MSRVLKKQDIIEILYGATLLGAGGGGSLQYGLDMVEHYEKEKKDIDIELLDIDEINDDEYAAMVAGLGSPVAMLDENLPMFGPEAVNAFRAYQKALKLENKEVKYLYSGEMGGYNTFVPMLVSILSGDEASDRIKLVDVDGNGRAVPSLDCTLTDLRGLEPYPLGLGNWTGDEIIALPTDNKAGEVIARQLCMAYDMRIGFATWGLNKEDMKTKGAEGYLTYAQKIGKALFSAFENKTDLLEELKKVMEVREFCRGKIEKVDLKQVGGFDCGVTVVKDENGKEYYVEFKNENLVLRDESGKSYITAPDIISMVDLSTMIPLTNADTKEGMDVLVLMAPVEEKWWREDCKAYLGWMEELRNIGFEGDQIRY